MPEPLPTTLDGRAIQFVIETRHRLEYVIHSRLEGPRRERRCPDDFRRAAVPQLQDPSAQHVHIGGFPQCQSSLPRLSQRVGYTTSDDLTDLTPRISLPQSAVHSPGANSTNILPSIAASSRLKKTSISPSSCSETDNATTRSFWRTETKPRWPEPWSSNSNALTVSPFDFSIAGNQVPRQIPPMLDTREIQMPVWFAVEIWSSVVRMLLVCDLGLRIWPPLDFAAAGCHRVIWNAFGKVFSIAAV